MRRLLCSKVLYQQEIKPFKFQLGEKVVFVYKAYYSLYFSLSRFDVYHFQLNTRNTISSKIMKKEITIITKSHLQTINLGVILTIYSLPSTMEQPLTFFSFTPTSHFFCPIYGWPWVDLCVICVTTQKFQSIVYG